MGEGERQQEFGPIQDEHEQEGDHHAGGDQRQHDPPDDGDAACAHQAGRVFERVGYLVDEGEHHPDHERQRAGGVDQDQPDIGVEQVDARAEHAAGRIRDQDRVVDEDRDRHHDRRNHADGQDGVPEIAAADLEARDRIGERGTEQERKQRRGGADQKRVAERLPDRERLLCRLSAQARVDAAEGEDLRVIVQRRRLRQPVRRPGDPFARILERGRDHPEDREGDEERPRQQDAVAQRAPHPLAPNSAGARLFGSEPSF